tara:strand:+ start:111 stop:314 length:204 start_codon:yes stop_codon:yes gene_type:complete
MKHLSVYIWSSGLEQWQEIINVSNNPYFVIIKNLRYYQYKKNIGSNGSLIVYKDLLNRYTAIYVNRV